MRRCFLLFLLVLPGRAGTIITFDDLPSGQNPLPASYGGVLWPSASSFLSYDAPQFPFTPHSGLTRVFSGAGSAVTEVDFSFVTSDQVFDGAWFAGSGGVTVAFRLYDDGQLVHTSGTLSMTGTPTFLDAGYGGPVDGVGIVSNATGAYVFDDVTYHQTPEPCTLGLFAIGGLALAAAKRSRKWGTVGV
jgi:hypothetical protein